MFGSKFVSLCCLFFTFIGAGCSSGLVVQEIPNTASVGDEISNLERDRNEAFHQQLNILAPKNFRATDEYLGKAKDLNRDGKKSTDILSAVATGKAYLKLANQKASLSKPVVESVLKSREAALRAEAPLYAASSFDSAESDLVESVESIEDGGVEHGSEKAPELQRRYLSIEIEAMRQKRLGPAQAIISKAIDEGAKDLAPKTLAWAEQMMSESSLYINAHHDDVKAVTRSGVDMTAAADRLLMLTREAKAARDKTPEDLAAELEQERNRMAELDKKAEEERLKLEQRVGEKESEVEQKEAELSQKNTVLESFELDKKLNARFESARGQFKKNEAEVYKDGGKLLIRMKGLTFPAGTAEIQSESFNLLGKLKSVLHDFGDSKVTIEGHTDAIGSKDVNEKLSAERARAVERYLVSNQLVSEDKVSSLGYGDVRPLASNKTKLGRAQNRRVDIIIEP